MHQDGSLADLTILSASSVEATLSREEQEPQGEWGREKEQALVVVMYDTDMTDEKPRSFSDPRQSSTEESHHCSAKTEPEPSTEQSSGTEQLQHSRSTNFNKTLSHVWAATNCYFHYQLMWSEFS